MHQGRRTVWLLLRLTQNPAGLCWQWMHNWMVCGSRRGGGPGAAGDCWAGLAAAVLRLVG